MNLTNKLISITQEEAIQLYGNKVEPNKNKISGLGIQPQLDAIPQLEKIISSVIGVITVVGVIFFTIQIILAGFTMISSQGDVKELETSKKRLTNSVMGLAIIVLAYGLGALITNLLGIKDIFNIRNVLSPIKYQ